MIGLNKKTEYALEMVVTLAQSRDKGPLSLRKIAEEKKLPLKFLEQAVLGLKSAGIVESKEGRGGGYMLVPKPKDITVAEVVEAVEGPVEIGGCSGCPKAEACGQKNVWEEVGDKVRETMEKKTIADLVCHPRARLQTPERKRCGQEGGDPGQREAGSSGQARG